MTKEKAPTLLDILISADEPYGKSVCLEFYVIYIGYSAMHTVVGESNGGNFFVNYTIV